MSALSQSNSRSYIEAEHIGVFDGFFSHEICQGLIDAFEYRNKSIFKRNDGRIADHSVSFGSEHDMRQNYELYDKSEPSESLNSFLKVFWEDAMPYYLEKRPHLTQICARFDFPVIKVQRTSPSEGYHIWHCEHGNMSTARRLMFVILYLNDIDEGGETEFLYQAKRVSPKEGRLVIAPAAYTHIHRGNPPLSGDKYILTSWLEFQE